MHCYDCHDALFVPFPSTLGDITFFDLPQNFEVHVNKIDPIFLPSCSCRPHNSNDTQFVGHMLFFADLTLFPTQIAS